MTSSIVKDQGGQLCLPGDSKDKFYELIVGVAVILPVSIIIIAVCVQELQECWEQCHNMHKRCSI